MKAPHSAKLLEKFPDQELSLCLSLTSEHLLS